MCFLFTMLDNPPDLLKEKISAKLVSFKDERLNHSAAWAEAKPRVLLAATAAPS
jgi:hypothetical protein